MRWDKKRTTLSLFLVAILILLYYFKIPRYLTIASLKHYREQVQLFVQQHYKLSVFLYITIYSGIVALSIPVSVALTIIGGFLFGTIAGAIYAVIGAITGGVLAFLTIRYLIGDIIQYKYQKELAAFNKAFSKAGAYYLLFLHYLPFFPPFFLVTIFAALTTVSLKTYIVTTFLGLFPGTFFYTFAGQELAIINSPTDIFTPRVIIIFCSLAVLSLLPLLLSPIRKRLQAYFST